MIAVNIRSVMALIPKYLTKRILIYGCMPDGVGLLGIKYVGICRKGKKGERMELHPSSLKRFRMIQFEIQIMAEINFVYDKYLVDMLKSRESK